MDWLKRKWQEFKLWLFPRYELSVSYNNTWGDADDKKFTVKKFLVSKEKHLKFITDEGQVVEIRGANGLNYRIREL